jgi:hypothetical protein
MAAVGMEMGIESCQLGAPWWQELMLCLLGAPWQEMVTWLLMILQGLGLGWALGSLVAKLVARVAT